MKISRIHPTSPAIVGRKRREGGSATLVFIGLLSIMMLLMVVNVRTLERLRREERLVEHQQIQRLAHPPAKATDHVQPEGSR